MRPEFHRMLKSLEEAYRKTSRAVDARIASFRYSGPMTLENPAQCREVLVRFYWYLYYPTVSIEEKWTELEETMFAGVEHLLRRDYGDHPWIQVCDQVISGVAGGLRAVMETLGRAVREELVSKHVGHLVAEYRNSTDSAEIVDDVRAYIREYRHLLPPEMAEGSGARLLMNYHKILEQHPGLIAGVEKSLRGG